jgi:hypothetical protein
MTPVKVRGRRHPKRRTVSAPSTSAADDNGGGVLDMTDDREFADALRERERLNEIERLGEEAGRERDARSTSALSSVGRTMVTVKTIRRAAFVVPETQYRQVRIKRSRLEAIERATARAATHDDAP